MYVCRLHLGLPHPPPPTALSALFACDCLACVSVRHPHQPFTFVCVCSVLLPSVCRVPAVTRFLKASRQEVDVETTAKKQLAARVADMKEQMSRHQQRVILVENEAKEARAQAEAALAAKDAALSMVRGLVSSHGRRRREAGLVGRVAFACCAGRSVGVVGVFARLKTHLGGAQQCDRV